MLFPDYSLSMPAFHGVTDFHKFETSGFLHHLLSTLSILEVLQDKVYNLPKSKQQGPRHSLTINIHAVLQKSFGFTQRSKWYYFSMTVRRCHFLFVDALRVHVCNVQLAVTLTVICVSIYNEYPV